MAHLTPRAPTPVFRPTTPMPSTSSASRTAGCRCGMSCSPSARDATTTPGPPSTCSTCSRIRRVTFIWVTRRRTPSAMLSRDTGSSAGSTSCTPSAGTRSACRPRTPRSSAVRIRWRGPTPTSNSRSRRCAAMRAPSTGIGCSTPVTRSTTTGISGSSSRCSTVVWPTVAPVPSTGAPTARPCWLTSRLSAACASAATPRSPRRS